MNNPLGVSPGKGKQGTTRGKEKNPLTSVGIERTTFGLDPPLLVTKRTGFQNRFRLMCNACALSDCTLIIIEPTVHYSFHWLSRDPRVSKGAYHLAKKIRKFRLKVKWNSNFQRWRRVLKG